MAEFAEVMKQKKRMCDSYNIECDNCGLVELKKKYCTNCYYVLRNHPQEAEEIIMNWAKEHPIKTNADKFKEVFGFEPNHNSCPYTIKNCDSKGCSHDCDKYDFWNKEYKEPNGE